MDRKTGSLIAAFGLGAVVAAAVMARPRGQRDVDPGAAAPGRLPRPDATAASGKAAVIGQLEESFREMYLALISIIQGFASAFLAERLFADPRPTAEQWLASAICFMMLICVWMEYIVGSTTFT